MQAGNIIVVRGSGLVLRGDDLCVLCWVSSSACNVLLSHRHAMFELFLPVTKGVNMLVIISFLPTPLFSNEL